MSTQTKPPDTEAATGDDDPLGQRIGEALDRIERLDDKALRALVEAPSEAEIDEERKLAERLRQLARDRRWRAAEAMSKAADADLELDAELQHAQRSDMLAARKAMAIQKRRTDPRARLAMTMRWKNGILSALAFVVVAAIVISATTVQRNIAGDATADEIRWWTGFFFEALVSVLLLALMGTRMVISDWGIKLDGKVIYSAEASLLAVSVGLNIFPYVQAGDWFDAGVHALPPGAMTVAVLLHTPIANAFAEAIAEATEKVVELEATEAAAAAEAEAAAASFHPTALDVHADSAVTGERAAFDRAGVQSVQNPHGDVASEHRAAPGVHAGVQTGVQSVQTGVHGSVQSGRAGVQSGVTEAGVSVEEACNSAAASVHTVKSADRRAESVHADTAVHTGAAAANSARDGAGRTEESAEAGAGGGDVADLAADADAGDAADALVGPVFPADYAEADAAARATAAAATEATGAAVEAPDAAVHGADSGADGARSQAPGAARPLTENRARGTEAAAVEGVERAEWARVSVQTPSTTGAGVQPTGVHAGDRGANGVSVQPDVHTVRTGVQPESGLRAIDPATDQHPNLWALAAKVYAEKYGEKGSKRFEVADVFRILSISRSHTPAWTGNKIWRQDKEAGVDTPNFNVSNDWLTLAEQIEEAEARELAKVTPLRKEG